MLLLIFALIIIIFIDTKTILKGQSKKTYIIYFFLISLGFIINGFLVLDRAPKTNPITIIEKIVEIFI